MNHLLYLLFPVNVPLKCMTTHPKVHASRSDADVWPLAQGPDTSRLLLSPTAVHLWHIIVEPGDIKRQ